MLWRRSSEKETLWRRKDLGEREEEERKGGVPRRDGEICTAFGMRRTRNCGFVAGDDSLEQSGENEELEGRKHQRMKGEEKVDDA